MVSIAILAGGKSRRMGRDKAFLRIDTQTVIERVIERVRPLSDDVFISTNSSANYAQFGLRLVADLIPEKATLGAIYSAIAAARHSRVLVVACDLPFLNAELLRYLISLAPAADVVAPLIHPAQPETTHTVYSKACLPALERRLQTDQLRIIGFFDEVLVHYVHRRDVERFDPNLYSFINMNTPGDWELAKTLAANL